MFKQVWTDREADTIVCLYCIRLTSSSIVENFNRIFMPLLKCNLMSVDFEQFFVSFLFAWNGIDAVYLTLPFHNNAEMFFSWMSHTVCFLCYTSLAQNFLIRVRFSASRRHTSTAYYENDSEKYLFLVLKAARRRQRQQKLRKPAELIWSTSI